VSVAALAAEELLLALPIVPLHQGADCGQAKDVQASAPTVQEQVTTRPFAQLRALLEQGATRKE
jgi:uncharacterized metal-binding protein YceD (DUF177 family)